MTLEEIGFADENPTVGQVTIHYNEEGYETRIARVDEEGRIAYYLEGEGALSGIDMEIEDTDQLQENQRRVEEEPDFWYPYDDLEVVSLDTYEEFDLSVLPE